MNTNQRGIDTVFLLLLSLVLVNCSHEGRYNKINNNDNSKIIILF